MIKPKHQVRLSTYSTIRIGGFAKWFIECRTKNEFISALQWAKENKLPIHILGDGSNTLFSDNGFEGLVIHVQSKGIQWLENSHVVVQAGESWDQFVQHSVEKGFSGIECLSGIPGLVGAAPIQNIGAYGQEVKNTIYSLEALHIETMQTRIFLNSECDFDYRSSIFKQKYKGEFIILNVIFNLNSLLPSRPTYPDLNGHPIIENNFSKNSSASTSILLKSIREAVLEVRSKKGMILNENDPDTFSLGSFFTNPIINDEEYFNFMGRISKMSPPHLTTPPSYANGMNHKKLSAAWLIENSGIYKGYRFKNAMVSSKHSLALTNQGGATATEILGLASDISLKVKQKFGIELNIEPEVLAPKKEF